MLFCLIDIVHATAQFKVLPRRCAALGVWHDVMELEKTGFEAPPLFPAKCAPTAVAGPHLALDRRRDVARTWPRLPEP